MSDHNSDWYDKQLDDYRVMGRADADAGRFKLPYPYTDDPMDDEINHYYQKGFNERRRELGDQFEWAFGAEPNFFDE